jgi:hypothetical protein
MLQGYNESRLKSSFRKFYGRFNDLVCHYKLSLVHMLNDLFYILFVRLSFPYWLRRWVTPYTYFLFRARGGQRGCLLLLGTWCNHLTVYAWFMTADCSVYLMWTYWYWMRIVLLLKILFEIDLTAGVTGQQRMLTPPKHLILPSHLWGVRVALHSICICF